MNNIKITIYIIHLTTRYVYKLDLVFPTYVMSGINIENTNTDTKDT